jgi:hypothetical protein
MNTKVDLGSMSDLRTPWCLRVVVTLRIAEHINTGLDQLDELAVKTQSDPIALQSVLRQLVAKGIFEEPEPGRFALNDTARELLEPGRRFDLDLNGIGGRMSHAWSTLLTYVTTGKPAYETIFGKPFWEDLAANPNIAASFDELMGFAGHGKPNADFDLSNGWDNIRTVVDVGGGTGAMLAELLLLRPHLTGTLVDFPATVARSEAVFDAAGLRDRVKTVGQSFFEPLPEGADLYLLRKVINDWPDQEATTILRRCAEACPARGSVVVIGGVSHDPKTRGIPIEQILVGGRPRSVGEFETIASEAGLKVVAAEDQAPGFVVECHHERERSDG